MGQSGEQAGLSTSMEWWTLLLLNEEISLVFPLFSCVSSWLFFFQNKNIQCTTYISATVYCFLAKLLVTHLSSNHWPSACQPLCHLASAFIWRYIGTLNHELYKNKYLIWVWTMTAKNVQMELALANIMMRICYSLRSLWACRSKFVIELNETLHRSEFEQSL